MKHYPIDKGKRRENEVRITDMFDRESIDIDKLVYLALHYCVMPIWIKKDRFKEEMVKISYLIEAYEKFLSKCEKGSIYKYV